MDPMDAMWMTRPPTVADAFGSSNVVFKSALKNNNNNNERKMTIAAGETPKLTQEPWVFLIPSTLKMWFLNRCVVIIQNRDWESG